MTTTAITLTTADTRQLPVLTYECQVSYRRDT